MKKSVLVFLLSLSLLGCGTGLLKSFVDTPEVKSIELKSFSIKDKKAVFDVALHNPNAFSLPISGLMGDMSLNDMAIGYVDVESDKSLAAHATQIVTVPIMLNPSMLVDAVKGVLSSRQAKYHFKGDIKTSVGNIPFSKQGDLSVQDLIFTLFIIR